MKITFDVKNQIIKRTDRNRVVADSKNYLYAEFKFSEDWVGNKTAVFCNGDIVYNQLIDNNICSVPPEVIKTGTLVVSVFGGDLITANKVYIAVEESGLKDGETPQPPTPDIYNQILEVAKNAEETATSIEERANKGDFDGKDYTITEKDYEAIASMVQTSATVDQELSVESKNAIANKVVASIMDDTNLVGIRAITDATEGKKYFSAGGEYRWPLKDDEYYIVVLKTTITDGVSDPKYPGIYTITHSTVEIHTITKELTDAILQIAESLYTIEHSVSQNTTDIAGLKEVASNLNESKVDKVDGKGLSSEDFTSDDKTTLKQTADFLSPVTSKTQEGKFIRCTDQTNDDGLPVIEWADTKIPLATETTIGGVKLPPATAGMTQKAGIDGNGFVVVPPGGNPPTEEWELLYETEINSQKVYTPLEIDYENGTITLDTTEGISTEFETGNFILRLKDDIYCRIDNIPVELTAKNIDSSKQSIRAIGNNKIEFAISGIKIEKFTENSNINLSNWVIDYKTDVGYIRVSQIPQRKKIKVEIYNTSTEQGSSVCGISTFPTKTNNNTYNSCEDKNYVNSPLKKYDLLTKTFLPTYGVQTYEKKDSWYDMNTVYETLYRSSDGVNFDIQQIEQKIKFFIEDYINEVTMLAAGGYSSRFGNGSWIKVWVSKE